MKPRIEAANDHWYTPPEFIEAIIDANPGAWWDIMTSPETPPVEGLYKKFGNIYDEEFMDAVIEAVVEEGCVKNFVFCNPPYSRVSGGAQKHIKYIEDYIKLQRKLLGSVYLVNYDAWVPRLADELALHVALIYPRIKFIEPGVGAGGSPRFANALLYTPTIKIPTQLGAYRSHT